MRVKRSYPLGLCRAGVEVGGRRSAGHGCPLPRSRRGSPSSHISMIGGRAVPRRRPAPSEVSGRAEAELGPASSASRAAMLDRPNA